jgi:energy-coupling factor transporter transmembrane protein EcfT
VGMTSATPISATRPVEPRRWHAATWLVWASAAGACVQLAPNPLYVAVVLAVAGLAVATHARPGPYERAFPILVAMGVAFALLRVVLTVATTHGFGHVILTLPDATLPRILGGFTVGGTVELPVLLRAAAEGFAIVGVIAAFAACNATVSHSELVQATPRAFHEVGLVVVVALAFVPSTLSAIRDVREADRARTGGRPIRRGRLVRQIVPVVELGLERAITLSESMDSRGFARRPPTGAERTAGGLGLLSLLALGGAFVALIGGANTVAVLTALAGVAALAGAVVIGSRGGRAVRYRPRRPSRGDWLVGGASLAAPAAVALLSVVGDSSLVWDVTPLRWPTVHVLVLLALVPLLAPVLGAARLDRRRSAALDGRADVDLVGARP